MKSPSVARVVLCDYASFLSFIVPVLAVGAYGFAVAYGWLPDIRHVAAGHRRIEAPDSVLLIVCAVLAVCIPLLVRRVRLISEAFVSGRPVEAVIASVVFVKDRGRIQYAYEYQAQEYQSGNAIMKNKRTKGFSVGQPVTVFVSASDPSTAFLKELYL